MSTFFGSLVFRAARYGNFVSALSNIPMAANVAGSLKPAHLTLVFRALSRPFAMSNHRGFSAPSRTAPLESLSAQSAMNRFIYKENGPNGENRENRSGWTFKSRLAVAGVIVCNFWDMVCSRWLTLPSAGATALVMTAMSSSEKVQCLGGPRPEVYALGRAGLLFYSGLMSFRSIQSEDPKDDKHWLTFWLLFSFFELAATVADVLLGWIIPYYNEFKLGFLVFLGAFGGAEILYPVLEPFFLKAEIVERKYMTRFAPAGFPNFTAPKPPPSALATDPTAPTPPLKPSNSFRAVSRS